MLCILYIWIRRYYVFSLHHTCFDLIKGGVKMKGCRKLASSSLCCTTCKNEAGLIRLFEFRTVKFLHNIQ